VTTSSRSRLRRIPSHSDQIASLLIELDVRTQFLKPFTHAGGRKVAQSVELKRNILAVPIAGATNLSLTRNGSLRSCGAFSTARAKTAAYRSRPAGLTGAELGAQGLADPPLPALTRPAALAHEQQVQLGAEQAVQQVGGLLH
jgi:hypothetical protein